MLRRARFLSVSAGTHRTAIWIAKSGGLQFFVAHAIQDRDRRVLNETSGESPALSNLLLLAKVVPFPNTQ